MSNDSQNSSEHTLASTFLGDNFYYLLKFLSYGDILNLTEASKDFRDFIQLKDVARMIWKHYYDQYSKQIQTDNIDQQSQPIVFKNFPNMNYLQKFKELYFGKIISAPGLKNALVRTVKSGELDTFNAILDSTQDYDSYNLIQKIARDYNPKLIISLLQHVKDEQEKSNLCNHFGNYNGLPVHWLLLRLPHVKDPTAQKQMRDVILKLLKYTNNRLSRIGVGMSVAALLSLNWDHYSGNGFWREHINFILYVAHIDRRLGTQLPLPYHTDFLNKMRSRDLPWLFPQARQAYPQFENIILVCKLLTFGVLWISCFPIASLNYQYSLTHIDNDDTNLFSWISLILTQVLWEPLFKIDGILNYFFDVTINELPARERLIFSAVGLAITLPLLLCVCLIDSLPLKPIRLLQEYFGMRNPNDMEEENDSFENDNSTEQFVVDDEGGSENHPSTVIQPCALFGNAKHQRRSSDYENSLSDSENSLEEPLLKNQNLGNSRN